MKRFKLMVRIAVIAIAGAVFGSCGGGGTGTPALRVLLFNFAPGFGGVHLNAPLELVFSAPVDPDSVNADSIRIFTTTTTTQEPDPGAPAVGTFVVSGNVVRFLPQVPQRADLSDAGLRIGFTYTIQVPASPDVIEPVRTLDDTPGDGVPTGRPNVESFVEFFTTLNSTILPAPGDITAEPNLNSLSLFFIEEGIENGTDPCPREGLDLADRDSPQVIFTDPLEGERGFGTITGIQAGIGLAFVRLDPITLEFSEPVGPWRIRQQNISIRNENLNGETFDLFLFFVQDRSRSRLQITVFDANSAFDQASVPQGRYVLSLTGFTDLSGNPLVNSSGALCVANGTFDLSFSTVSSPSLPTDIVYTFEDDDGNGTVDVGGLATAVNDSNEWSVFDPGAPFLGGISIRQDNVLQQSPSEVTTTANAGDVAFWTGGSVRFDTGYRGPDDPIEPIPSALRLRGGSNLAATPILSPIAGRGSGASSPSGSTDGAVNSPTEPGKIDFLATGDAVVRLFTGDALTGPIVYQYNRFELSAADGNRPLLTARSDSIFPMILLVETDALVTGDINLDGGDGEFGFNGFDDATANPRGNPGGFGGEGIAGGGDGGDAGASVLSAAAGSLSGKNGEVPVNVLGPLTALGEALAGVNGMSTGGGGLWDETQAGGDDSTAAYQGGGGAGFSEAGASGSDLDGTTPGVSDHGVGGQEFGNQVDFSDGEILATGGAGGGGGAAEDDGGGLDGDLENGIADAFDDGGGGGGAGGGFFSLSCGGDLTFGLIDVGDPEDPDDDNFVAGSIRCNGGRGGSTFADFPADPDAPTGNKGTGEAGGGGGGGVICLIAGNQITFNVGLLLAYAKRGGNSPDIEGGDREAGDEAGAGGAGLFFFADVDGINPELELGTPFGTNDFVVLAPTTERDLDGNGEFDPLTPAEEQDLNEMTGLARLNAQVWGDDPLEQGFGKTEIVSEFFDTLSDSVVYDEVRTLSNAPRFNYAIGAPDVRAIRVFLDATVPGALGLPDLTGEDALTGELLGPGHTYEAGLHFDRFTGLSAGEAQFESRDLIQAGTPTQGKRYARVRIIFDLGQAVDTSPGADPVDEQLLRLFAPPGAPLIVIADDPDTPDLENTLGNIDTALEGVPAVAELRVRFTP